MRTHALSSIALWFVAGCSVAPTVGRAPLVPPLPDQPQKVDPLRDQPLRADADRSPPLAPAAERIGFYETQPTFRTVVHVVETPVYAEAPATEAYVPYSDVDYYGYSDRRHHRWRGPYFPINTAVGAGIGAIIGHQSRHRGRGALIGGSIGLLFDMGRWWR